MTREIGRYLPSAPVTGPSILAQLSVRRGIAAIEFYRQAFGAVVVYQVGGEPDNPDVVAQLVVGQASFRVSDESPPNANFSPESLGGGSVRLLLMTDDPDAAIERHGKASGLLRANAQVAKGGTYSGWVAV